MSELKEAAELLALHKAGSDVSNSTGEVIEERFDTFGGVARECFLLEEIDILNCRNDLANAIDLITNPRTLLGLVALIKGQKTSDCHHVLHWVPLPEMKGKVVITLLAYTFVKEELAERLMKMPKEDRDQLRKSLAGFPNVAAFDGWLFEIVVHETLGRGCTLQLRPLPSKEAIPGRRKRNQAPTASKDMKLEPLEIEEGEIDEFKLEDLSPEMATLGPYHQTMSKSRLTDFISGKCRRSSPLGRSSSSGTPSTG